MNIEYKEIFDRNNINRMPLLKYIKSQYLKTGYLYLSESKNFIINQILEKIR